MFIRRWTALPMRSTILPAISLIMSETQVQHRYDGSQSNILPSSIATEDEKRSSALAEGSLGPGQESPQVTKLTKQPAAKVGEQINGGESNRDNEGFGAEARKTTGIYRQYRLVFHLAIWLFFTG